MANYIITADGGFYSSDALYHHGVKGQKWGVRRFQRKDGSLTPAGKKRVNNYDGKLITVGQAKGRAYKAATAARRQAYRDLNESPKRHNKLQYDVAAIKSGMKAHKASIRADKAHNKQVREERAANNPNRKRELTIAIGTAAGTALAAYGVYKVTTAVKNKAFKNSMDRGIKCAKKLAEMGRMDSAFSSIDAAYSHYGDSIGTVVKRAVSNNSVNGRVDWRGVAKTFK
jgi:hypothetical protein